MPGKFLKIRLRRWLVCLLVFLLYFGNSAQAQEKLTPEEKILHDKLVHLLFNFDQAEWELMKTELRYKNFPVYSLSIEAIREAYFRQMRDESWVFSEDDGPEVIENRFALYEKQEEELDRNSYGVKGYLDEIGRIRLKEDYERLKELVDKFKPRISNKKKLIFLLDEERRVKSIYYGKQDGHYKPLPKNTETALLNFLKENNYQAFETTQSVHNAKLFWLNNKYNTFKWRIRKAFRKKKYRHYE